ncbi:UDP-glucuronosyltransferase 1-1-like isoform X1 [Pelobates cultripes]|uniref:glucuronosyltransferase n=1 Tax=Pelobates cultripes TaxID=61616 RepID=A0AAD1SPS2_PELCU|nr:UDP-glucuronosyltransferase 1-1-like isoform X1 [Pelobates cultripes]
MELLSFSRSVAWLLLVEAFCLVEGGKLLVVPMDGSHWLSMKPVVEKLTKNGHQVVVVTPESTLSMSNSSCYSLKTYSVPYSSQDVEDKLQKFGSDHFINHPFPGVTIAMFNSMLDVYDMFRTMCAKLLFNKELIQNLREDKYDALLTDPFSPCGMMVAEHLGIPNVSFLRGMPCMLDYTSTQCSSPLSYVPRIFSQFSDKMTFMQRLKNLLIRVIEFYYCAATYAPWEHLASKFLEKEVNIYQLLSRTSIWIMRYDFVFDYPRPVMPNMKFVGGINCVPKKNLSKMHSYKLLLIRQQGYGLISRPGHLGGIRRNKVQIREHVRGDPSPEKAEGPGYAATSKNEQILLMNQPTATNVPYPKTTAVEWRKPEGSPFRCLLNPLKQPPTCR